MHACMAMELLHRATAILLDIPHSSGGVFRAFTRQAVTIAAALRACDAIARLAPAVEWAQGALAPSIGAAGVRVLARVRAAARAATPLSAVLALFSKDALWMTTP